MIVPVIGRYACSVSLRSVATSRSVCLTATSRSVYLVPQALCSQELVAPLAARARIASADRLADLEAYPVRVQKYKVKVHSRYSVPREAGEGLEGGKVERWKG